MNNIISQLNISVIAECSVSEQIEKTAALILGAKIYKFNTFKDFSLNFDLSNPGIVLMDYCKIAESGISDIKAYIKEEFDIPFILLAKNEQEIEANNLFTAHESIIAPYTLRETELVINLALERHFSEKTLKNGDFQYKMLLESSSDIFTIINANGTIEYESPSVKKMLGYSPEELSGKTFFDLILPEDLEHTRNLFKENISKNKNSFLIKFRYLCKNGQVKIVEAVFNNFLQTEGVQAIIITGRDITEKRTIEKKFLTNIKRYNALIEDLPIGIYRSTPSGELLMANSYLIKMLGFNSFREIERIALNSLYVQQSIREIFKELIDKYGEAKGFEFEIRKKNGEIIFVRDSSRAVYNDKGAIVYYEGVLEDITDKKKYESEILFAKENAEKADKLKSYFMAHLSHEIRTPVNSIITFVSLLKDAFEDKLTDELKDCFSIIGNSADRLIRTIDLIMNISSLQTGNFDTHYEWLDVEKDILDDVLRDYDLKARYKGVKLLYKNKSLKNKIYADRYSASQLFSNLIDNAIKYTPKNGEIEIILHQGEDNLLVDVIDTGIGISHEYLPNLFTPFTQEEMGYTRKYEGNGLGLAIAKKYAELNNAMIKVKSVKGKGSNFSVIFKDAVKITTENF